MKYKYEIIDENHFDRRVVEDTLEYQYWAIFKANLDHFFPKILKVYKDNKIISLAGVREAQAGCFFLERYLEAPVEKVLSEKIGGQINRMNLLEVGNLVSLGYAGGLSMIIVITIWSSSRNFQWVVCTVTRNLYAIFNKLGMEIIKIKPAKKEFLDIDEQNKWGNYYENEPVIIALNVENSKNILKNNYASYYFPMEMFDFSLNQCAANKENILCRK